MERRTADLGGPVHYLEFPGPSSGPTFLLIHGLGGSHANWLAIAPYLARRGRVLILDLPGFGLSPLAGRKATMSSSRSIIARFIGEVAKTSVILIGNSMGGALSIAQAAADPDSVNGLVLIAPALPRSGRHAIDTTVAGFLSAAIVPKIGGRLIANGLRRYGAQRMVDRMLALCTVDPTRVPKEIVDAHLEVAMARTRQTDVAFAFLQQTRSLVGELGRRRRFMDVLNEVSAPTLLIGGACDRLVPRASVDAIALIRPDWDHVMLDDCGHVPMLEDPQTVSAAIDAWLAGPASWILQGKRSLAGQALAI